MDLEKIKELKSAQLVDAVLDASAAADKKMEKLGKFKPLVSVTCVAAAPFFILGSHSVAVYILSIAPSLAALKAISKALDGAKKGQDKAKSAAAKGKEAKPAKKAGKKPVGRKKD